MSDSWIVEHTKSILSTHQNYGTEFDEWVHWRTQQRIPQPVPDPAGNPAGIQGIEGAITKHVQLGLNADVPVEVKRFLGRGMTSEVHEVDSKGTAFALKRRRVLRRNMHQELNAFEKERANMERVNDHRHVAKIIATFVHSRFIGILMWPVAICDLGAFFDDLDPLWQLYLFRGRNGCVHRERIEQTIDAEAIARLETLKVLHTNSSGQSTFFTAYLRLDRSFGCLAGALAYLHDQKVKHKDLKPSNILLTVNNILITDFGTSTDFSADNVSVTDTWGGTPKYFAPEVAAFKPSGRAADVFSLGCIFLEMMCVHYGTSLGRLQSLRPDQDRSFQANLGKLSQWLKLIDLSPSDGFGSLVAEMLEASSENRPSAPDVLARLYKLREEYNHKCSQFVSWTDYDAFFGLCCARQAPKSDDR